MGDEVALGRTQVGAVQPDVALVGHAVQFQKEAAIRVGGVGRKPGPEQERAVRAGKVRVVGPVAGDLHLRPVAVVQVVVGEGTAQEVIGNLCPPRPGEVHSADATVGGPAAELGQQGGRDWVVARVPAITELPGEETGVGDPRPE